MGRWRANRVKWIGGGLDWSSFTTPTNSQLKLTWQPLYLENEKAGLEAGPGRDRPRGGDGDRYRVVDHAFGARG